MYTLLSMMSDAAVLQEGREIVLSILLIVMCLLAVAMVVIILKQSGDPENLGAITGSTETYYAKNKSKSRAGWYKKATVIIAAAFVILSVVYFILAR